MTNLIAVLIVCCMPNCMQCLQDLTAGGMKDTGDDREAVEAGTQESGHTMKIANCSNDRNLVKANTPHGRILQIL